MALSFRSLVKCQTVARLGGNLFRPSSSPSNPTATLFSTTSFASSKKSQLIPMKASQSKAPPNLNRFPHSLRQWPTLSYYLSPPSRYPLLWTFRLPNRSRPLHPPLPHPPQRTLLCRSHLLWSPTQMGMQRSSTMFLKPWPLLRMKNHLPPSLSPHLPWNLPPQFHHPPRHLLPRPLHLNLPRLLPTLNLRPHLLRLRPRHGQIWPQLIRRSGAQLWRRSLVAPAKRPLPAHHPRGVGLTHP